MRFFLPLLFCLLFFACQKNESTTATPELTPKDTSSSKVTIEGAEDGADAPAPGTFMVDDDPDRFPYLEPLNDSTIKMAAYTVRLEATHQYPLQPLVPERTPWFKGVNPNEGQGIFMSYVLAGRRLMLSEPNIRVDYINKNNTYYSNTDSAILSVQAFFMTHPDSKILKEQSQVETKTGEEFEVIEVLAKRDTVYSPKYQAFAYMDYNDDYLLSVHLTTLDFYEFKDALPFYYRLLRGIKVVDR
jgi:hypothetical protein